MSTGIFFTEVSRGRMSAAGDFAACSFFAFPLGADSPCQGEMSRSDRGDRDRWPEGPDEGAGFGFPLVGRTVFRVSPRGASDFLDAQKVTKKALGGGRNRRFGRASRLHAARPLEPPLRGVIPWDGQKISGAQNLSGFPQFFPAHWGLVFQKLRLVRLHRRA